VQQIFGVASHHTVGAHHQIAVAVFAPIQLWVISVCERITLAALLSSARPQAPVASQHIGQVRVAIGAESGKGGVLCQSESKRAEKLRFQLRPFNNTHRRLNDAGEWGIQRRQGRIIVSKRHLVSIRRQIFFHMAWCSRSGLGKPRALPLDWGGRLDGDFFTMPAAVVGRGAFHKGGDGSCYVIARDLG
jgi:hypothetical protein